MKQFHLSREISDLITTVFLLGYVFGVCLCLSTLFPERLLNYPFQPLFWGPGSELVGRKPVFVLSMTLYTLSHIGQALAPNIQTLLITRFLSGFFAVAPLTNCGGKGFSLLSKIPVKL